MARTFSYRISEMDCAEEIRQLKAAILPLIQSENQLEFDLLRAKLSVHDLTGEVSEAALRAAIASTGMHAEPWAPGTLPSTRAKGGFWQQHGQTLLFGVSGILLLTGFTIHALEDGFLPVLLHSAKPSLAAIILYTLAAIAGAWYVLPKALHSLRRIRPDMNLLMTLAILGAMLLGDWLEAGTVSFLFALSLLLESWSVERARESVEALLALTPATARVMNGSAGETTVHVSRVKVGSIIRVHPGERIPLDGTVRAGRSAVNQAPITGESLPVDVVPGSEVYAGTVNGDSVLEIRTTRPAENTTLAHIIRLVEAARSRRARSERWVDRFASIYTPAMMGLAALVAVGGPVLFGGEWVEWAYRALVVLVIACPCALVISTPVSVVAGLTAASRAGVLIKGGVFLEAPAHLRAIAFDKTGTLTTGQPVVTGVVPLDNTDPAYLLSLAAALEKESPHPLARAIVEHAFENGVAPASLERIKVFPGLGVQGWIDGRPVWAGGNRLLAEHHVEHHVLQEHLETLRTSGATAVTIFDKSGPLGLITLADRARKDAASAVKRLRKLGIKHIAMLTGDNRHAAEAIARAVDVDTVHPELLPGEKQRAVEKLRARYQRVAMVGDGVNDAPALAAAPLSIAMGAIGTDAAIETADIALMSDNLSRIAWLVRHSRRSLSVIRWNIGFALGIKAVFLALAAVNAATLWMAITADMGTSLLVTFNALRLLDGKFQAERNE